MKNNRFLNRNKYGSRKTKCFQGHYHPSMLESNYCNLLADLKKTKDIYDYTTQKKIEFRINGKLICSHYVDFWVERIKGEFEAHETKGFATNVWHIKHKLFLALYPDIPYIVIK